VTSVAVSGNIGRPTESRPGRHTTRLGEEQLLDHDDVREYVMHDARRRVRELVVAGMTPDEIDLALADGLNETERDLVWVLARHEFEHGSRIRAVTDSERLVVPG
jgi:hypothetical protein